MSPALQERFLSVAQEFRRQGRIDSIRLSARPDELEDERLDFLEARGVETVEIGVQSLCDRVLRESRRGATVSQALETIKRTRGRGFEAGAQIMVGLPGDSAAQAMQSTERLCEARPDFVRIYPVLVLRDTELADWFQQGRYHPLSLEEAVEICAQMLDRFERARIPVVRVGLHADREMLQDGGPVLAGPVHAAFGFLVRARVFRSRLLNALQKQETSGGQTCFRIHPHDRPLFSGHRGETVRYLEGRLGRGSFRVEQDENVVRGRVEVTYSYS